MNRVNFTFENSRKNSLGERSPIDNQLYNSRKDINETRSGISMKIGMKRIKKNNNKVFFLNSAYLNAGILKVERRPDLKNASNFKNYESRGSTETDKQEKTLPVIGSNTKKRGSSTNVSSILKKDIENVFKRERSYDPFQADQKASIIDLSMTMNNEVQPVIPSMQDKIEESFKDGDILGQNDIIKLVKFYPTSDDDLTITLEKLKKSMKNLSQVSLTPNCILPNYSGLISLSDSLLKDFHDALCAKRTIDIRMGFIRMVFEFMTVISQFTVIIEFVKSIQVKLAKQIAKIDPDCTPEKDIANRLDQLLKATNTVYNLSSKDSNFADSAIDVILEHERREMYLHYQSKSRNYEDVIEKMKNDIRNTNLKAKEGSIKFL